MQELIKKDFIPQELLPIQSNINEIFKNDKQKASEFISYLMQVISSNDKLRELDIMQVSAGVFQLWARNVNVGDGEGYIIPYNNKATTQIGYKYLVRKIWESGELLEPPQVFELKEGDLNGFSPHTRDVDYKKSNIKTEKEYQEWQERKRIGWVLNAKMINGHVINKFFWEKELTDHASKYSNAFKNNSSIWRTNRYEMMRKTAFLRMVNYLPKTQKLNQALQDINKLNLASYDEINENAKPIYVDNPTNQIAQELSIEDKLRNEITNHKFFTEIKQDKSKFREGFKNTLDYFRDKNNIANTITFKKFNQSQLKLFKDLIDDQTIAYNKWWENVSTLNNLLGQTLQVIEQKRNENNNLDDDLDVPWDTD